MRHKKKQKKQKKKKKKKKKKTTTPKQQTRNKTNKKKRKEKSLPCGLKSPVIRMKSGCVPIAWYCATASSSKLFRSVCGGSHPY